MFLLILMAQKTSFGSLSTNKWLPRADCWKDVNRHAFIRHFRTIFITLQQQKERQCRWNSNQLKKNRTVQSETGDKEAIPPLQTMDVETLKYFLNKIMKQGNKPCLKKNLNHMMLKIQISEGPLLYSVCGHHLSYACQANSKTNKTWSANSVHLKPEKKPSDLWQPMHLQK